MSETEDNRPVSAPPDSGETDSGPAGSQKEGAEADVQDTHAYLRGLVEAILFVAEAPLSLKELARAAKIDRKRASELLEEIRAEYKDRGLTVQEVAEGFCFRSNPVYATYVRGHLAQRPVRLSRAQLETLSIIAYRQPITRPEVDDIRGVDSGPVLKGLLERDLIKILGKKDEPGRPMLYGTSAGFLELFNMKSLQDLPTLKEFTELSEESRLKFEQTLGVEAPEGPIGDEEDDDATGPVGEPAALAEGDEGQDERPSAEDDAESEDGVGEAGEAAESDEDEPNDEDDEDDEDDDDEDDDDEDDDDEDDDEDEDEDDDEDD